MAQAKPLFDLTGQRVWVAGHRGMVGSALVRRLQTEPCETLTANRKSIDLRRQEVVESWIAEIGNWTKCGADPYLHMSLLPSRSEADRVAG